MIAVIDPTVVSVVSAVMTAVLIPFCVWLVSIVHKHDTEIALLRQEVLDLKKFEGRAEEARMEKILDRVESALNRRRGKHE